MRKIFRVNGKIFYSEKQFKKYILDNKLIGKTFPCKFGIYSRLAYVGLVSKRRYPAFNEKYQVHYIHD